MGSSRLNLRVFIPVRGVLLRIPKAPYPIRSVMPTASSAIPSPVHTLMTDSEVYVQRHRRGHSSQRCVQPSLLEPSRDHQYHQHNERNLRAFRVIATDRHVYTDTHTESKSMSHTSGSILVLVASSALVVPRTQLCVRACAPTFLPRFIGVRHGYAHSWLWTILMVSRTVSRVLRVLFVPSTHLSMCLCSRTLLFPLLPFPLQRGRWRWWCFFFCGFAMCARRGAKCVRVDTSALPW